MKEKDQIITDIEKLRTISKETTMEEVEKLDLVNKLREANGNAWTRGCGLSAIQIGVPLRFAWLNHNGVEDTLINPEIILKMGKYINHNEGCLSIPEKNSDVIRYEYIEYISNGKKKKAKYQKAIIIQHEIDHMNGILNIDK